MQQPPCWGNSLCHIQVPVETALWGQWFNLSNAKGRTSLLILLQLLL